MAIKEVIELVLEADKAKKEGESFGKSLTGSILKANVAMRAVEAGFGLMVGQIKAATTAAVENERTNIRLAAALKSQGREITTNMVALNQQAASLESLTNISDETIRSMQGLAVNLGVMPGQTDEYVRAAIRMSNALNIDVNSAMRQLIKSLSGQKGELRELLPFVGNMTEAQLKHGDVIKEVNKQFKDSLGILTEGTSGSATGLVMAWGNLGEAIAGAVLNMAPAQSVFSGITEELNRLATHFDASQGGGLFNGLRAFINSKEGQVFLAMTVVGAPLAIGGLIDQALTGGAQLPGAAAAEGGGGGSEFVKNFNLTQTKKKKGGGGKGPTGFSILGESGGFGGAEGVFIQGEGEISATRVASEDQLVKFEADKNEILIKMEEDLGEKKRQIGEDRLAYQIDLAKRTSAVEEKAAQQAISTAFSVGSAVLDIGKMVADGMAKNDKERFDVNKGFAIADAILNGAKGVAMTMGSYIWPYNLIAGAAHAATAVAQVAVIASQQYTGGSSSGSVGSMFAGGGGGGGGGVWAGAGAGGSFAGGQSGGAGSNSAPVNITIFGTISEKDLKTLVAQIDNHVKRN